MSNKVVGIIGGMGPEATVDLMTKIIRATPAKIDQEHIRLLVDNNPQVPSRVEAIMGQGESPGPMMAKMAVNLEKWGAELLAIPCNTAHFYINEIFEVVKIPVINMIDETIKVLLKDNVKDVAVLATTATLKTKLYEKKILEAGINLFVPSPTYQEKVMKAIFGIKSGNFVEGRKFNKEIINHVLEKGASAAILGCTELPIAFVEKEAFPITFYDPTQILAQAIVHKALN